MATFAFRKEKGTGAETCPAIVSGIVTSDARSIVFPSLVTVPEVFAKVNWSQFPSRL